MNNDAFQLLQERHVMSIMLYLNENGSCGKTEIYGAVSRGTRMPDKLINLERYGLIEIVDRSGNSRTTVFLTDKGRRVGELISAMKEVVDPED